MSGMRALPILLLALGVFAGLSSFTSAVAENIDPANDGSQYAWAENVGWMNAEPANCSGCGVQVEDFELMGWLWAENAGWISLSCENTTSCGAVNYGVTNDGHGNLDGVGWAENIGWINFAPATSGAGIDPNTGEFSGYLWAENAGWVSLSCTNTSTCGSTDYGIKTSWCQSTASVTGTPDMRAARSGSDVELSQLVLAGGAAWHEIVRGVLSTLRNSGGDYSTATDSCAADNVTTDTIVVSGTPPPSAGDGYWYLARRVNCKGKGTFDSGGTGQIGARDSQIAASGNDCP